MPLNCGVREKWQECHGQLNEQTNSEVTLKGKMMRQKLRYFGLMMKTNDTIAKEIMLGIMEGHRWGSRPCTRWTDAIYEAMHMTLEELNTMVKVGKNVMPST